MALLVQATLASVHTRSLCGPRVIWDMPPEGPACPYLGGPGCDLPGWADADSASEDSDKHPPEGPPEKKPRGKASAGRRSVRDRSRPGRGGTPPVLEPLSDDKFKIEQWRRHSLLAKLEEGKALEAPELKLLHDLQAAARAAHLIDSRLAVNASPTSSRFIATSRRQQTRPRIRPARCHRCRRPARVPAPCFPTSCQSGLASTTSTVSIGGARRRTGAPLPAVASPPS